MTGRIPLALLCGSLIAFTTAQRVHALKFGSSFDAERPPVSAVATKPKSYLGKTIGFRSAACVDRPKGSFLCLVTGGGHTLKIEAGGLGPSGGDVVGERLIGPCKGEEKLRSPICRFDIEIQPTSAQDEATMAEFEGERVTRLYTGVIEMRVASR